MPLFPVHYHKTKTDPVAPRVRSLRRSFAVIQLTPRRPRGKHSLTNHRLKYLKSIGCRNRRRRLRPFSVRVYKVERLGIGGWR
jgi:hypothetical protein